MTRWGRALLLALLIITLMAPIAAASPAVQAGAPTIASAELRLWPEYDDPGLLVIFSGDFSEGTTFPLQAAFPITAGARNVQATYQDASGGLINREFEIADNVLKYELPSAAFHFEYYVDRTPSGNERQIQYAFQAPYAITALRVAVQQPARATGFTLTPAAETTQQGTDGLTYHVFNRSNVAAGETLAITINYTKADTALTAPGLSVTATDTAPTQAPAAPATSTTDWLPWVLIGAGVALAVGLLAYWLVTRRQAEAAPAPVHPAPRGSQSVAPRQPAAKPLPTVPARPTDAPKPAGSAQGAAHGSAAFCPNCGNALKPEDRFCAQCGAPRRS